MEVDFKGRARVTHDDDDFEYVEYIGGCCCCFAWMDTPLSASVVAGLDR